MMSRGLRPNVTSKIAKKLSTYNYQFQMIIDHICSSTLRSMSWQLKVNLGRKDVGIKKRNQ
jgi:hypothetical protein